MSSTSSLKTKILLIEDEVKIRKFITVSLKTLGMKVEEATNAGQGIRLAGSIRPELIICDLGLPDMDGLEVIKNIREFSDIPIVVLSARSEDTDIIKALDTGADDYLIKPFSVDVLAAHIRAALRKSIKQDTGTKSTLLECAELKLDTIRHEVFRGEKQLSLSPKEYDLLKYLMTHNNKMLTHENILSNVWGTAHKNDDHYLRIYISQIRKKIEPNPENPVYIITEPGIGYRLDKPAR